MLQRETPSTEPPTTADDQGQGRAGIIWPGIIIGLLSVQILLMLVMAYVATSDRTFAVEPDYYQKALNWDELAAQDRLNEQLGWSAHIKVSDAADLLKRRTVTCTLTDAAGQPLSGAEVEIFAFPHARAGQRLKQSMPEQQAGDYATLMQMARDGLWEFRITAVQESQRFTRVIQQRIKPPGAAAKWRR
jgi:nitrogen fixation protein FixH